MIFKFFIEPQQQERPRAVRFGNGVRMYDPKATKLYKETLALIAKSEVVKKGYRRPQGALAVSMTFVRSMPKSFTAKQKKMALNGELLPRKKPDLSNFVKSTEDALNGILWDDDNAIVQEISSKVYGQQPRVIVEIHTINDNKF